MVRESVPRLGMIAAEALVLVRKDPDNAYAHAITRALNSQHGERYTHNLEVGNALRWLVSEGILESLPPVRGKGANPRLMYGITSKAGFYLALSLQQA